MQIKTLLPLLFIISLFTLTSCMGDDDNSSSISIMVPNTDTYVMSTNATITIPFSVSPTATDVSAVKIKSYHISGDSNESFTIRNLTISKVETGNTRGEYVATIAIENSSTNTIFTPESDKKYNLSFGETVFHIGNFQSNKFDVTFTQQ